MIRTLLTRKWCSSSCSLVTPVSTPSPLPDGYDAVSPETLLDDSSSVSSISVRSTPSPPPPVTSQGEVTVPLFSRECVGMYLRVLQSVLDLGYFSSPLLVDSLARRDDTVVLEYQHLTILLVEVARGLFFLRRYLSQPNASVHGDESGRMRLACFLVYRLALEIQEMYDSSGLTTVLAGLVSRVDRQTIGVFEFQCQYIAQFIPLFTSVCALSSPSANFAFMFFFLETEFDTMAGKYSRSVVEYLMYTIQRATYETSLDVRLFLTSPRRYYECKLEEYRNGLIIGKEAIASQRAYGCDQLIALVRHKYKRPLAHLVYLARDRANFLTSASRVANGVCDAKDVETVHRFVKDHLQRVISSPSFAQPDSGFSRTKSLLDKPNPVIMKSIVCRLLAFPPNDQGGGETAAQPHAAILNMTRFLDRFIQASKDDGIDFKLECVPLQL